MTPDVIRDEIEQTKARIAGELALLSAREARVRQLGGRIMTVLKWTVAIASVSIGGVLAWRAIQAGRQRVREGLARAEAVADRTRAALEETESALHAMRTSV